MVATAPSKPSTIDDLAHFPDDGKLREIIDGQVVEWDVTNIDHGFFAGVLARIIGNFVLQHRLGMVTTNDALVRILGSASHARGADIAFFSRRRIPKDRRVGATTTTPDFVIEILSPTDRAVDVQEKIHDWLRSGVRLLWYIDPMNGTTAVYTGGHLAYVDAGDSLEGGDVLPGLSLRMQDIFDELAEIDAVAVSNDELDS